MASLGRLGAPLVILSQASAGKTGIHDNFLNRKSLQPLVIERHRPVHDHSAALVHHKEKDPEWDGKSVQEEPKYSGDYPKDDNKVGKSPAVQKEHVYNDDYPKDGNGSGKGGSNSATKDSHHAEASSSSTRDKKANTSPPLQPEHEYHDDYVKDENGGSGGYSPAEPLPEFSPASGHSAQWYQSRCSKIKAQCEERKEAISRAHREKVQRLEDEYKHHTRNRDRMENRAAESQQAVDEQKTDVKKASDEAKAAAKVFEETKNCPKELRQLEDELEKLEAEPNDSDSAIDAECQKKKEILNKEGCVERYLKARATLARRQRAVGEESDSLSEHRDTRDQANGAVQPYQDSTDDSKTALDRARDQGASGYSTVDEDCRRQLQDLEDLADQEVAAAEAEYKRHKHLMESRRHQHHQTEEDVAAQRKRVGEEQRREDEARETYDRLKDCPAELEKAERELRELEAMPNDSDEAIDAECEKKKVIMRKRRCVDEFSEARDVLTRRESTVSSENRELTREQHEERVAESAAKSYEDSVRSFKKAWEDATAARRALQECSASESESSSLVGGGGSEGPRGGAGMRHPTVAWLVSPLMALLLHHRFV